MDSTGGVLHLQAQTLHAHPAASAGCLSPNPCPPSHARATRRRTLLEARGWRVASVPFYHWAGTEDEDRRELLRRVLAEVRALPQPRGVPGIVDSDRIKQALATEVNPAPEQGVVADPSPADGSASLSPADGSANLSPADGSANLSPAPPGGARVAEDPEPAPTQE